MTSSKIERYDKLDKLFLKKSRLWEPLIKLYSAALALAPAPRNHHEWTHEWMLTYSLHCDWELTGLRPFTMIPSSPVSSSLKGKKGTAAGFKLPCYGGQASLSHSHFLFGGERCTFSEMRWNQSNQIFGPCTDITLHFCAGLRERRKCVQCLS